MLAPWLSAQGSADRTLHELAGQGDCQGVARLLGSGMPIDERDDVGCTALHFAADRGNLEAMELLIKAGADVNASDEDGQRPLHYAALCGNEAVGAHEAVTVGMGMLCNVFACPARMEVAAMTLIKEPCCRVLFAAGLQGAVEPRGRSKCSRCGWQNTQGGWPCRLDPLAVRQQSLYKG